ncbi:MAG: DUF4347 domain-containing protein [Cyanobacteriota bacterium]|nr:DUF4347 domain-containing protein [Cyanobacteriota bacterium]
MLSLLELSPKTLPAIAQSITATPDGTGTTINHNGSTYNITGGTQTGANLFHSFIEFGLNPQEIANFLSNPDINNVLGRVTGGNPSVIQGLIQLSGGNSNLFLMNPAGWVFSQGASLDVPGSFGVTTATRMGFGYNYFNAYGDNAYSELTGNPTSLIFDQSNPSWIINEGNLEVNPGESLWAVGGGIISTGTITAEGGQITLASVPGKSQVKLSHEGMVLNLILEAAPARGSAILPNTVTGIRAVDIPRYLSGGSNVGHVNNAIVEADGTVRLVNSDTVINEGDTIIAGIVNARHITFAATEKVKPTANDLVSNNPVVVLFPEEIGTNVETTFIDEGIEDYQNFLYGGKKGTISQVIARQENGISSITEALAEIANQGGKVSAIHLLAEGNEGEFWLGRDYISSENVGDYEQQMQAWAGVLTAEADILLYSCLTALGYTGEELINALAGFTGADVAASTNLTGSEALGGDWVFESQTGTIEVGLGFEQQVLEDFAGKLQVFTASDAASLISAIDTANSNSETDTINLAGDITLTAVEDSTDGENGLPSITASEKLTINGMGNTIARDTSVSATFRLLHIAGEAEVEINETTFSGGVADGSSLTQSSGGAILNRGKLTLNDSTISGNTSDFGYAGGIFTVRTSRDDTTSLTLNNSTVSGNTTEGGPGGGIAIFGRYQTSLTLNNSTVSGNSSITSSSVGGFGGGIFSAGLRANAVTVTLNNSTVSGNTATRDGGGIYNFGSANSGVKLIVGNSIVADNTANRSAPDVARNNASRVPITDRGNNLIGIDTTGAFTTSTLVGSSSTPVDAKLQPLGDYGGSTQTHAILSDSPAFDAGSETLATGLSTDQRGETRTSGTAVDIGAFELQQLLSISGGNNQETTVNTAFTDNLEVKVTDEFGNAVSDVTVTLTPPGTGATASLGSTSLITNASGIATTNATANTVAGDYQVEASFSGLNGVNLNLTNNPGAANLLSIFGGNNQSTTVNTTFTDNLEVKVTDEFGNAVSGVIVTLTPPGTGATASLGSTSLTTNASGIATTNATANTVAGDYQVKANSTGLTTVNFDLANNPGAANLLSILGGNNQETTVNTAFTDNLEVKVTDEFGNAVSGVIVTLTPPGTGATASLGSTSLTTDASGIATTNATANTVAGDYQIKANSTGLTTVNFDLANIADDSDVTNDPGDSDTTMDSSDTDPIADTGIFDAVTDTDITDFSPIWQSVLDELSESELGQTACQTIPEIEIELAKDEEDAIANEKIEAGIQWDEYCRPVVNEENELNIE